MPEHADRRQSERFPVNADAACPFVSPVVENFGPVRIRDVSMHGVGLIVSRKVEPGTLMAVTLTNQTRGFSKTVLVRVTHSTPLAGGFLVGGSFTAPLTYQDMTTLVM
ncbi:MAG: PilZ domain-containing protein [Gemmataceae bacterium]